MKFFDFSCLVCLFIMASHFTTGKANAGHNEVNGCGSGSTRAITPDGIFSDFRSACDNHDRCYGTLGISKDNCDNIFLREMRDKCNSTYPDVLEIASLRLCLETANIYYEAVKRAGGDAYRETQAHAQNSLTIISSRVNSRVLDFTNSERNGEPVLLVNEHRGASQQWHLVPLGNGHYLISSRVNGRVLDFTNSERNGEPVLLVDEHRGASQQWNLVYLGNSHHLIKSRVNGRVLDFTNSERNGEPVLLVDEHRGASQQWNLGSL